MPMPVPMHALIANAAAVAAAAAGACAAADAGAAGCCCCCCCFVCYIIWLGVILSGLVCSGVVQYGVDWCGVVYSGLILSRVMWCGLVRCMVLCVLVWFGLVVVVSQHLRHHLQHPMTAKADLHTIFQRQLSDHYFFWPGFAAEKSTFVG